MFLRSLLVTTSKALVSTSVALAPSRRVDRLCFRVQGALAMRIGGMQGFGGSDQLIDRTCSPRFGNV